MIKKIFYVFFVMFCSGLFPCFVFSDPVEIPEGKVVVYPNPWIPESRAALVTNVDTKRHGHLTADGWVKFAWRKDPAQTGDVTGVLKIYSVTGDLVRRINWNATVEAVNFPVRYNPESQESKDRDKYHIIHWDGKNDRYEYVESGVYIWTLYINGGHSHNGKIVVIR